MKANNHLDADVGFLPQLLRKLPFRLLPNARHAGSPVSSYMRPSTTIRAARRDPWWLSAEPDGREGNYAAWRRVPDPRHQRARVGGDLRFVWTLPDVQCGRC